MAKTYATRLDRKRTPPLAATLAALIVGAAVAGFFTMACSGGGASRPALPAGTAAASPPSSTGAMSPTTSRAASTSAAFDESLDVPGPGPGPCTVALSHPQIYCDEPITLRCRVETALSEKAAVTIVVRRPGGGAVATLRPGHRQPCNRTLSLRFRRRLPAGRYRYTIYAVDDLGREQISSDTRPLIVSDLVPKPPDIKRAVEWLKGRSGCIGFAVVDSEGHLHGWHSDRRFVTASVVKAMMLVAYLRTHPGGPGSMAPVLDSMIEVSDNDAASSVHGVVGDAGMYTVARAAGMKRFVGGGYWSGAMITAADQARFFSRIFDLVPKSQRTYARRLLSHIASYQSWGIPAAARHHGWTVFFKGGWRGTDRGQLVHQVARLEKDGRVITIAVMTDGDASMGYGIETIRGAAERVLGVR